MKTVTINKTKVKIFEEDDLINKLNMSSEDSNLVLEYQRRFPELLQDGLEGFVIDGEVLWNELNKPQGEYSKWFKRKIKPIFTENIDYLKVDKLVVLNKRASKVLERHIFTLESAKHIAMMTGSDKNSSDEVRIVGNLIRNYFIKMESVIRNYEKWSITREPEKKNWNYMMSCLEQWCKNQSFDYADKVFRTREANMINESLTGRTALELKLHIGYKDKSTREHLNCEINKAIDELQLINSSLLLANMDFETRKSIIKSTCDGKYKHLHKDYKK